MKKRLKRGYYFCPACDRYTIHDWYSPYPPQIYETLPDNEPIPDDVFLCVRCTDETNWHREKIKAIAPPAKNLVLGGSTFPLFSRVPVVLWPSAYRSRCSLVKVQLRVFTDPNKFPSSETDIKYPLDYLSVFRSCQKTGGWNYWPRYYRWRPFLTINHE